MTEVTAGGSFLSTGCSGLPVRGSCVGPSRYFWLYAGGYNTLFCVCVGVKGRHRRSNKIYGGMKGVLNAAPSYATSKTECIAVLTVSALIGEYLDTGWTI